MAATEWIGTFGGLITSSAILPQIYKSYKHQSTRDLSWAMFGIFYVGVSMNLVFGIIVHHPAIYITAIYSICTNTALCFIKWYFEIYTPNALSTTSYS